MKRFLPLRHYSCAPTTQGHLLDSFRWVEGARGRLEIAVTNSGTCPLFVLADRRRALGRCWVLSGRLRSGRDGFSCTSPNDIRGFNPEAR